MAGAVGSIVSVNIGSKVVQGVVQADVGDTKRTIWHPDADGVSHQATYPRRDPEDYGPEGGGGTWYPND